MTLVELSNIFNIIAQGMPELNNYHFGFLSDIDINIKNNFNPSPKCQTPYPLALFEPPSGTYDPQKSQSTRIVDLWIVDRQQGDKNGTTCQTLVEKMSFIEGIGNSFLRSLKFAQIDGACLKVSLKNAVAGTELDGYQFKDRLVTYKMTFSINTPYDTNCLTGLEISSVQDEDLERVVTAPPALDNQYSMLFDGVDEYLFTPATPELSFGNGATDTPFSISVWLVWTGTGLGFIANKRGSANSDLFEYQITIEAGGVIGWVMESTGVSGGNSLRFKTNNVVPVGVWTNVVVTYDGSSTYNGLKCYINGLEVIKNNVSVGNYVAMNATNSPLILGRTGWASGFYYKGILEEFSIFNTELDLADVTELYNMGLPTILTNHTKAANLVLWSRMGDGDTWNGANWELFDNSTNSNTLTSVNMEEVDRVTNVPT